MRVVETPPILSVRGIRKSFGAIAALRNIDLDVRPGEVMALLGDNGAGKSTLIKVIAGVVRADQGEIVVDGRKAEWAGPDGMKRLGVETVYQELALISTFDTVKNLYLGREKTRFAGMFLDHARMEREASQHLVSLGIRLPSLREKVRYLSGGQRQAVAIGRATGWGAKLIIMDEPTAALGVTESRQVLELIKGLRTSGVAVILISHNIEHVFEIADRMTIMRRGTVAGRLEVKSSSPQEAVGYITGAIAA